MKKKKITPIVRINDPELEENIIECLTCFPGARKREIAYDCRVSVKDLIRLLYQMCDDGKLYYVIHRDMANMEYYEKYFVKR